MNFHFGFWDLVLVLVVSVQATIVAAYEARHSLWTMSRQIPVAILGMGPMMIVCHLAQDRLGLPTALALGWIAFWGILLPLTRSKRLFFVRT